ncbi:MAG: response regulator [Saprospiraceae bacterium]|nr:response regulator [Saprospiraceae bacterium]
MKKKLNCILLVDDDAEDNYFHQIIINEMNITERIEVALNGVEALNFLKKENQIHPDIIFLDINMPKMNGWEFMEAYKELRADQKAKVVVVMLTTSENPEDKKRAGQFPDIIGFNSKPLTEEILNRILEHNFPEDKNETTNT